VQFSSTPLLLLNPSLPQAVLKKALPQLAPLMHDSSPKVREAMAELLLTISACRDLHFYDVVPLETLLQVRAAGVGVSRAHHVGGAASLVHCGPDEQLCTCMCTPAVAHCTPLLCTMQRCAAARCSVHFLRNYD
jgi:hypothetical protein